MLIRKSEIIQLSDQVRKAIEQDIDFRDNKEGVMSILKNDIYTLIHIKNGQIHATDTRGKIFSEFMEDIAHQLKTPITSMRILADLLPSAPKEKQDEFSYQLQISLNQMEWLVTNLLKMAKLEAGVVTFNKTQTTVKELVNQAITTLAILLELKNQSVQLKNDIVIFCDKLWTVEALTNIIKNAAEHSEENACLNIDCGDNPIYCWLSITDTGKGIDQAEIATLFKRFEKSDTSDGYGIGLPLALAIIRSQNGDIDIESELGKGTTFTMKFYH